MFEHRDNCGLCVLLNFGFSGAVIGLAGGEAGLLTWEDAGLAKRGESIDGGLGGGNDAGVKGIEKFFLGRSMVVTGASTLTVVGAW